MGFSTARDRITRLLQALFCVLIACSLCLLAACGEGSASASGGASASVEGSTSGPEYTEPATVVTSVFDGASSKLTANAAIDTSTTSQGYVGASASAQSRLKLLVIKDDVRYNYDMPTDGSHIIAPINMGNGLYTFKIMQNTSGSNYVEVASVSEDVVLENEFVPFLHPNIFCNFTAESACVKKAFELAADAKNEGDVVRAIYDWMTTTITYDNAKASQLANTTGYIPDPDATLTAQTGICFDYASLAGAMFRSLGIPCQVVTGYVSPNDIYHAWNMIYIDGQWVSAKITIDADKWCRVDMTFAASNGGNATNIGDGTSYTDRYVY